MHLVFGVVFEDLLVFLFCVLQVCHFEEIYSTSVFKKYEPVFKVEFYWNIESLDLSRQPPNRGPSELKMGCLMKDGLIVAS